MAYTVTQKPSKYVVGSRQDVIYVVEDDTNPGSASVYKYKYICDIYIGGTKRARLKTLPNSADCGVFQINRVVDDYLEATRVNVNGTLGGLYIDSVNRLGVTAGENGNPFGKNVESLRRIELKFGFEYATSATADPTIYADQITGENLTFIKSNRKLPTADIDNFTDGSLDSFEMSGTANTFISVVPRVSETASIISTSFRYDQDIESGQSHCVSFLNDATTSTQTKSPKFIHVAGYQADGTQIFTDSIENVTANGGEDPTTANSDDERLIYFGSGFLNLTTQSDSSTINTGMDDADLSYFEIVAANSSTLSSATVCGAVYRFNVTTACKYETRRIMFLNEFGGWDFYNFEKKSVKTSMIEREGYHRVRGNWDTANGGTENFGYEMYDGGRRTNRSKVKTEETLNTDWIGEEWNPFMLSLFSSNEVYLLEQKSSADYAARPVVISDTQFLYKTSVNDKLASYSLKVTYSNDELQG